MFIPEWVLIVAGLFVLAAVCALLESPGHRAGHFLILGFLGVLILAFWLLDGTLTWVGDNVVEPVFRMVISLFA